MNRALGYLRDAPDGSDPSYETGERRRAAPRRPPSLRHARRGRLFQGAASACVGFALARCLDLALTDGGVPDAQLPSPAFLYANARRLEHEGSAETAPPLRDRGCYPRLALRGAERLGFCRWDTHPYDIARINAMPPVNAYREAFDQRGLRFLRVTSEGAARTEAVNDALARGLPVLFGMDVDRAFQNHRSDAPIASIDAAGILGGHMMAVLAVEDAGLRIENWWADWGEEDGTAVLTRELFGSRAVADVYVLEHVPPFAEAEL